jgi:hypothetical protein
MNAQTTTPAQVIADMIDAGQYEQAGNAALELAGATMTAKLKDTKRANWDTALPADLGGAYRPHWRITLRNKDGKRYAFDFWDSIKAGEKGAPTPTAYAVLSCLQWFDPGTPEDFAGNFGYDPDSIKARKVYHAVSREARNLSALFTEQEREAFAEIH